VGVRGTMIYIGLLADGTALYYVGEGGIDVKMFGRTIVANEGEIVVIRPGGEPEVGKLKPWQKALFAALFDPDNKSGVVPNVPGMPDRGDQLKNLLRNKQGEIIDCYSDFSFSGCYGLRRKK
jgi:hypothetical protein